MGPKKGKGKSKKGGGKVKDKDEKGPKKPKLKKVADGLRLSEMTSGQIMAQIKRLLEEKNREAEEMQLFFLERHKLYALWNLAMEKVRGLKDEVSNSLALMEQSEKQRDAEKDFQNTKLRQLQNEETKKFGMIRLHHLNYMRSLSDEIWEIENIFRESAVGKRALIRKALSSQYEVLRGLHANHMQTLSNMSQTFSSSIRAKEVNANRNFENRHDATTLQISKTAVLVNNHKYDVLENMYSAHELLYLDMQTYFNDMTTNNFAVMKSIEEEIETLRTTNNRLTKELKFVKESFSVVNEALERTTNETSRMTVASEAYDNELRNSKILNKILGKKKCLIAQKEMLIEIITQQTALAKEDAEQLRRSFSKGLIKIQSQISMGSLVNKLKAKTARKDASLLHAISVYKGTRNTEALRILHRDQDNYQQKIRRKVEGLKKDEFAFQSDCKNPKNIDAETREYNGGLRNREDCIPPRDSSMKKWMKSFQGKGQMIQTNIRYKGRREDDQYSRSLKHLNQHHHDHDYHEHATQISDQSVTEKVEMKSIRTAFKSPRSISKRKNKNNLLARKHDLGYGYYLIKPQDYDSSSSSSGTSALNNRKKSLKFPLITSSSMKVKVKLANLKSGYSMAQFEPKSLDFFPIPVVSKPVITNLPSNQNISNVSIQNLDSTMAMAMVPTTTVESSTATVSSPHDNRRHHHHSHHGHRSRHHRSHHHHQHQQEPPQSREHIHFHDSDKAKTETPVPRPNRRSTSSAVSLSLPQLSLPIPIPPVIPMVEVDGQA